LAAVYCELERWSSAERYARRALELEPDSQLALINLAEALNNQGDVVGQTACLERAVRLDPDSAPAHWNLSLALLLQGDFERGWQHYEWRERAQRVTLDPYPFPRWQGQSLDKALLLVHGEQGVGDEILFASCYDELLRRAGHFVLVCDSRLAPLFRRSLAGASVIGYERRKDHQPVALSRSVDWQVPAGSVPLYFRRRAADFPRRTQFLYADPQGVQTWRERLAQLPGRLRVGISWRAGGQPAEHRKRSTNLATWQPLLSVPGVDWVNLQYGDTSEERAWAQAQLGVTIHDWPEGDPLIDLDGFAARLTALDLVISVGNATIHLAGALGVPAWAILPRTPNWRWGLAGEQSIWYSSVRLVRQQVAGSWQPVFDRLATELRARIADQFGDPPGEILAAVHLRAPGAPALPAPAPRVSGEVADIHAALKQAVEYFEAGRLEPAESLCRAVLCLIPRQLRALQLLSQLCRSTGRLPAAHDAIRRALHVQERAALCHEYALVLLAMGRPDESQVQLARAIEFDPSFQPARDELNRLGLPGAGLPAAASGAAPPHSIDDAHRLLGPTWLQPVTGAKDPALPEGPAR
ncbi:MAG TPA: tetratricopeptide repeat protein, partial [Pirellulales bacterium]|nr:tetratricopeptide repeat protein [Pirellulales bacterium]